jgi:hypothetical protein
MSEADDAIASAGLVIIKGLLAATEADDNLSANGSGVWVGITFDPVDKNRITAPAASAVRAEGSRIKAESDPRIIRASRLYVKAAKDTRSIR